jgi:hypothetical protein
MFSFDRKSPIEMRDCGNNLNLVENENIFSSYSLPEVTGPLISSSNRKSVNLQTYKICYADLPHVAICGFAVCGPNYLQLFVFCGINFCRT